MSSSARSVLVTGGCGLVGYHVVQLLLKDSTCGPITVVSRNPNANVFDGVKYVAGDLGDAVSLGRVFDEFKPQVVIHTASQPTEAGVSEKNFFDTNVTGTSNLIEAAKKSLSTQALVFTSTVNVVQGDEHINLSENERPYWTPNSKALACWRSKTEAEKLVLAANSEELKTVSLRLCKVIGVGDRTLIPLQLDTLARGKTNVQLGNNTNLFDTVSAENSATAHLLAMHALLDPKRAKGKVDGEAFNITDGHPLPFWDVQRIIWQTGGDKTELKDVKVIPSWLATSMAWIAEFAYGMIFFGTKSPELNRQAVSFCIDTNTYNISKAKTVLGYNPVKRTEEGLREATEWEMQKRAKANRVT